MAPGVDYEVAGVDDFTPHRKLAKTQSGPWAQISRCDISLVSRLLSEIDSRERGDSTSARLAVSNCCRRYRG